MIRGRIAAPTYCRKGMPPARKAVALDVPIMIPPMIVTKQAASGQPADDVEVSLR